MEISENNRNHKKVGGGYPAVVVGQRQSYVSFMRVCNLVAALDRHGVEDDL